MNFDDFAQVLKDSQAKYVVIYNNNYDELQYELFDSEDQKDFWLTNNSSCNIIRIMQVGSSF